ncbi:hypothetical protein EVAR_61984_1 [Eumeta japonica]|uniref:Uncharacterized protein n=1 Tax=Eumeta variegata TaxID=151549 RepID=A0A4C1YJB4_EUMVA|nr:hypothetical protein EVAR_61984_1 [Eumeta japonica]
MTRPKGQASTDTEMTPALRDSLNCIRTHKKRAIAAYSRWSDAKENFCVKIENVDRRRPRRRRQEQEVRNWSERIQNCQRHPRPKRRKRGTAPAAGKYSIRPRGNALLSAVVSGMWMALKLMILMSPREGASPRPWRHLVNYTGEFVFIINKRELLFTGPSPAAGGVCYVTNGI